MNILYNRLHCTTPCQSTWDRDLKSCLASHPRVGWTCFDTFPRSGLGASQARGIPHTLTTSHEKQYKGGNITLCAAFEPAGRDISTHQVNKMRFRIYLDIFICFKYQNFIRQTKNIHPPLQMSNTFSVQLIWESQSDICRVKLDTRKL